MKEQKARKRALNKLMTVMRTTSAGKMPIIKKKQKPKPSPKGRLFTETKAIAFTKTEMRALRLAAIRKNMNLTKYMRQKLIKGLV